jgi:hypothetical protein
MTDSGHSVSTRAATACTHEPSERFRAEQEEASMDTGHTGRRGALTRRALIAGLGGLALAGPLLASPIGRALAQAAPPMPVSTRKGPPEG